MRSLLRIVRARNGQGPAVAALPRNGLALAVAAVACLAPAGPAAAGEPGADLTPRWRAPEETSTLVEVERRTTTSGDALMGVAASISRLTIVYGEKVDAVREGRPFRLRRKYARYETRVESVFGDRDLGAEVARHPIAGRVLSFEREGEALVPAQPVPRDEDAEPPLLAADWEELLPGRRVAVGEGWTAERLGTLDRITGIPGARAQCTLRSIDEESGRAAIGVKVAHEPRAGVRLEIEGTVAFDPGAGKVVEVELKGRAVVREGEVEASAGYRIRSERRVAGGEE